LAFADGNDAHHKHRAAIAIHTFARSGSSDIENFENITTQHIFNLIESMKSQTQSGQMIDLKMQFAESIASIFIKYFTNIDVNSEDEVFQNMITAFDVVFQEVNSSCIGDVLPYLMPFINKSEYVDLNAKIRTFTEKRCFEPILKQRAGGEVQDENNNSHKPQSKKESNVINDLLDLVDNNEDITLEHVFYAFEDIIGGHAAVSNSLIRIIRLLARNPQVQKKIREEVRDRVSGFPTVTDRLTYTEATIWEAFRFISSPIVPHVATVDTTINGKKHK
jgi:cytochrome P450 family 307 subfamily A